MPRPLLSPVLCLIASAAVLAVDGGEWFEVAGGAWEPDATTLATAKTVIRARMDEYFGRKLTASEWDAYSFQYQGTSSATGQHLIHLNAFHKKLVEKITTQWDYSQKWLRVGGGGSWFFQADFDPETNAITNLKVNSPK